MMNTLRPMMATLLIATAAFAAPAAAQTANFDNITASPSFAGTSPTSPAAIYSQNGITFTGGVVLNGSNYGNEESTTPNLYATGDIYSLSDGSFLPGIITGAVSSSINSFSSVALDIENGNIGTNTFTVSAYNTANLLVSSTSIALGSYQTATATGHVSLSGLGINSFKVSSDQATGAKDFAVDTVSFTLAPALAAAAPEPSIWAMMIVGFGLVGAALRRRKVTARIAYA